MKGLLKIDYKILENLLIILHQLMRISASIDAKLPLHLLSTPQLT